MQIEKNTVLSILVGILASGILVEGLHVDKVSQPHIPHQVYFLASTSNLTFTVTMATTSGRGILLSTLFQIQNIV